MQYIKLIYSYYSRFLGSLLLLPLLRSVRGLLHLIRHLLPLLLGLLHAGDQNVGNLRPPRPLPRRAGALRGADPAALPRLRGPEVDGGGRPRLVDAGLLGAHGHGHADKVETL